MDYSRPLVEISHLTKVYGNSTLAVNNMNLVLPRGRIIGLLGPNGSGKSTLIKMINGLLTPTDGHVLINGELPGPDTKAVISYLPERTYLLSGMKVDDIIRFFADFYADFSVDRAYTMLNSLGIPPHAQLKTLSKGTKEKVQLILVMSRDAEIYVLDEPLGGVDPATRDYILDTILSNFKEGSTVIISTHLIDDIERILDEVVFIDKGKIILHEDADILREKEQASINEIFRRMFKC